MQVFQKHCSFPVDCCSQITLEFWTPRGTSVDVMHCAIFWQSVSKPYCRQRCFPPWMLSGMSVLTILTISSVFRKWMPETADSSKSIHYYPQGRRQEEGGQLCTCTVICAHTLQAGLLQQQLHTTEPTDTGLCGYRGPNVYQMHIHSLTTTTTFLD